MGVSNAQVIIGLAESIIEQSRSNHWVLSRGNYDQLGKYNVIIALRASASEQQKKQYCYLLFQGYESSQGTEDSKLFGHLLLHFRRLCQPLFDRIDSFMPTEMLRGSELSSPRVKAVAG